MVSRLGRRHWITCFAAMAIVMFFASVSHANLLFDVKAVSSGTGYTVSADGKTVTVDSGATPTVEMAVYATIGPASTGNQLSFGAGQVVVTNGIAVPAVPDASVWGRIDTSNFYSDPRTAAAMSVLYSSTGQTWDGSGSNNPAFNDINADGFMDLGGTNRAATTGMISPRAAAFTNLPDGTELFRFRYIVDSTHPASALNALVNFVPCTATATGSWKEALTTKNPSTSSFAAGTPVQIALNNVPEPTSLLLLGMGILGAAFCYRRRR